MLSSTGSASVDRIGLKRVERLEADNAPRRFDVTYLKRVKAIFSAGPTH